MTQFNKYAKITPAAKTDLPQGPVTIQHKLDGSNAGIQLDGLTLIVHSRNNALARIGADGGVEELTTPGAFAPLVRHVAAVAHQLIPHLLLTGTVHIYGEWLVKHTVQYPAEMYGRFYVYDYLDEHGHFVAPQDGDLTETDTVGDFGFYHVSTLTVPGSLTHEQLRAHTLAMQERLGYRIEGTVVKSYEPGLTDRWGDRLIYKDVLPDYKEVKGTPDAAHAPLSAEHQLLAALPERTIEKRYLDVVAANEGRFEGRLIPQIMGRVWHDFVQEVLAEALRDAKYPVVNTKELKRLVDHRARTFALERAA